MLCLPYVQGLNEKSKIEKQTKDINIRTVFTEKHMYAQKLSHVRQDPQEQPRSQGCYVLNTM